MENLYIKQYPDLMQGRKIMYVHGFGSSAQSGTVKLIRDTFPNANVVARDIPIHPEEALNMLISMCEEEQPDLIIGTSMGGMYAEMLHGRNRILVNPAFGIAQTMHEHNMMGKQVFQNPRADGVQEFIVTKALVKEYAEIAKQNFTEVTNNEQQLVYGLFGDEDPVVHTFDLFREHYLHAIHFHGEHRLSDKSFFNGIVPVVRWINDKIEGREREIIYISFDAMIDQYNKPKSSVNKAFSFLIERYNVYITAPALTNNHESITFTQLWVEQYLSTPAYNRIIFTNNKDLLYGDFLIDTVPSDNAFATPIIIGSDEFKTWEEVITYFDRLR